MRISDHCSLHSEVRRPHLPLTGDVPREEQGADRSVLREGRRDLPQVRGAAGRVRGGGGSTPGQRGRRPEEPPGRLLPPEGAGDQGELAAVQVSQDPGAQGCGVLRADDGPHLQDPG